MSHGSQVTFVQGFGRRDLFTGVAPERLWGWARNVGLLVAQLDAKGIAWSETYATDLTDLQIETDLIILRDWRYPLEQVEAFRDRHASTPMVSMVFQAPRPCLEWQEYGEMRALFGLTQSVPDAKLASSDTALFRADRVVIRSRLVADLFVEMGADIGNGKIVRIPHAPIWSHGREGPLPAKLPVWRQPRDKATFDLLFIGDSVIRKGLFRLYDAFRMLKIPGKRLHVYSRFLHDLAEHEAARYAAPVRFALEDMLADPDVLVHAPYQDIAGLGEAHRGVDLLVCPSLIDHGPNTLMEACQLGVPVLASTMCGAADDLPREAVMLEPAPRWWSDNEAPQAFTCRLAESISGFHEAREQHRTACPYAAHEILDKITEAWEAILGAYLT
jgi:glycosyltransferase involved in cell wall biosynthesis